MSCHLCFLQVIPIVNNSLLTVLLQFVRGPGPLLNPGTSQASNAFRCTCMRWWSIRESSFTEYVIHTVLSSSDSDLFVCYFVLPGNAQDAPLPSAMSSVQSFPYSVAVRGHTSALYRRVDRISLLFTSNITQCKKYNFYCFPFYSLQDRQNMQRDGECCLCTICNHMAVMARTR